MALASCANNVRKPVASDAFFIDNEFERPIDLPRADQIFQLTKPQQDWIENKIRPNRSKSMTKQIIHDILKQDYGLFDYDNSYTRSASQTLTMRQGNCLSMVIMTAAIAEHMGIEYQVNDIKTAPVWDRDGGLYLINGHVNIALRDGNPSDASTSLDFISSPFITLDFMNSSTRRHYAKRRISHNELTSMYFSNLAADAMVVKDWDRAYWLLRQSIASSETFSPAWNSLAVLYRYNQQPELAEVVYKHAMAVDVDNMNAVTNYALLLESQGRYQELFAYQRKIDLAQLENPYRYFDRGDIAYSQQNYRRAIAMYKKAIQLSPYVDRFYFALFRAHLALGEKNKAIKNLQLAYKRSADHVDRQRYNAKLAVLRM